jgi:hypothetical protein
MQKVQKDRELKKLKATVKRLEVANTWKVISNKSVLQKQLIAF